jgi:hypothetical protein
MRRKLIVRTGPLVAAATALLAGILPAQAVAPSVVWVVSASANTSTSTSTSDSFAAVAATPSRAWAVGATAESGRSRTLIELHTSTGWTVTPSPNYSGDNGLDGVAATSKSNAWAVGGHTVKANTAVLVEHWDGTKWSKVSAPYSAVTHSDAAGPPSRSLSAVTALSSKNVWAVGDNSCNAIQCPASPLFEHYNGKVWTHVVEKKAPYNIALFGVGALDANHVWAVGTDESNQVGVMEGWNGKAWHKIKVPTPGKDNDLFSVTAAGSHSIWAVGQYEPTNSFAIRPLIMQRVNGVWKDVPAPKQGRASTLYSVSATSATNVWAVGNYESNDDVARTLVEHYDGKTWTIQPTPNTTAFDNLLLGVVALSTTKAYAVGEAETGDNGPAQTLALHGKAGTP